MLNEINPVTLWNTEKKELIGIFSTQATAARYLYPERKGKDACNISQAIKKRNRINPPFTRFPFPVAVRFATQQQCGELGEQEYIIMANYPYVRVLRFQEERVRASYHWMKEGKK